MMREPPYTVSDEPEVVRRIERDLQRIRTTLVDGDPRLRSLVLTGGFARGEGAMLDGEPQNDYDLIAVRGLGPANVPYRKMTAQLEKELGLHVDLAPVAAFRLPFTPPSIFWYETANRNRLLWGREMMGRVPARTVSELHRKEGLRLLSNRAAGLLLVSGDSDAHSCRLQAAKGLLAAADVHMLALGAFPPSQTERHELWVQKRQAGTLTDAMEAIDSWVEWGYCYKVAPGAAPYKESRSAWRKSAEAMMAALPVAMEHAGLRSLEECRRHDRWVERIYYLTRVARNPNGSALMWNPTGEVRFATFRLLAEAKDGIVRPDRANRILGRLHTSDERPLKCLERMRGATLQ